MMRNASHKLAPLPTPRSRYSQQEQKHIQVYASAYTHTCIMPGHTKPARTRARDASGRGGSHLHGVLDELAGTSLGLLPRHPALLDVARGDPVHTTDKGGVGLAAIRVSLLDTVNSGTGTTVQSGEHATMAVHKRCNNHENNPAHDSQVQTATVHRRWHAEYNTAHDLRRCKQQVTPQCPLQVDTPGDDTSNSTRIIFSRGCPVADGSSRISSTSVSCSHSFHSLVTMGSSEYCRQHTMHKGA